MWLFKGLREDIHRKRRADVVPFFMAQLEADPVALGHWIESTQRIKDLYTDYIADHWSRKMRMSISPRYVASPGSRGTAAAEAAKPIR